MRTDKIILLLAGACAAATQARADARSDVLAGIQRCGVIQDDRVWLDCVYGANQPMRGHLGLSPAPEFQQRLVPQPGLIAAPSQMESAAPPRTASRPAPQKKAGFFSNLIGNAQPVAVSRMAAYRYDGNGAFIITLENGQEWRQANAEGVKGVWIQKPSAYTVTVTDGAFGTYNLRTSDSPHIYKVERLK